MREYIYQKLVWLDEKHKVLTPLKLTNDSLLWDNPQNGYCYELSFVVGARTSSSDPSSVSIMVFDSISDAFLFHQFWLPNPSEAFELKENLLKFTMNCTSERNIAIIMNPISGNRKGREVWDEQFQPALRFTPFRYSLFETTDLNYIEEWVQNHDITQFTDLVCLGGDGTLHLLITAIDRYYPGSLENFKFGILPTGSTNSLACELGARKIKQGILNIIKGYTAKADLLKIKLDSQEVLSTCAMVWGVPSDICNDAQNYRFLGSLRYGVVGFMKFFRRWRKYQGRVVYENEAGENIEISIDYVFVIASNHKTQNSNNNEMLTPFGRINDGLIDIQSMVYGSRWDIITFLRKSANKGSHIHLSFIQHFKTKSITIEPADFPIFNIDGEIYNSSKAQVQIIPEAITYLGILYDGK